MNNTALEQKPEVRKWTKEEYERWKADGTMPNSQAPDHSTSRRLAQSALRRKFEAFHAKHPEVYEWIVYFAQEMKAAGYRQYGMSPIIERVRWHIDLNAPKDDSEGNMRLKINNNHRAFYARLVMENEPTLRGFFEIREQTHEE